MWWDCFLFTFLQNTLPIWQFCMDFIFTQIIGAKGWENKSVVFISSTSQYVVVCDKLCVFQHEIMVLSNC